MTEPVGSLVPVAPLCTHEFGLMSAQSVTPKNKPLLYDFMVLMQE